MPLELPRCYRDRQGMRSAVKVRTRPLAREHGRVHRISCNLSSSQRKTGISSDFARPHSGKTESRSSQLEGEKSKVATYSVSLPTSSSQYTPFIAPRLAPSLLPLFLPSYPHPRRWCSSVLSSSRAAEYPKHRYLDHDTSHPRCRPRSTSTTPKMHGF